MVKRVYIFPIIVGCIFALSVQVGYGTLITVNTSSLAQGVDYTLYFTLIDTDGIDVPNNTATITGFNLNGGFLSYDPGSGGGDNITGDLSTSLSLTDSTYTAYLAMFQIFQPGTTLQFDLNLTTVANTSIQPPNTAPTPDQFTLSIYDNNGPLPTTAYDIYGTLILKNIDGTAPIQPYDILSVVPEPTISLLFLGGLGVLYVSYRTKRNKHRR